MMKRPKAKPRSFVAALKTAKRWMTFCQKRLQFQHFFAVQLGNVGVDLNSSLVMGGFDDVIKVLFLLFQRSQLIPNKTRISVAFGDVLQAPLDGSVNFVQVFLGLAFVRTPLFTKAGNLSLELANEGVDQLFIAQ